MMSRPSQKKYSRDMIHAFSDDEDEEKKPGNFSAEKIRKFF